jgi:hypothetical protein
MGYNKSLFNNQPLNTNSTSVGIQIATMGLYSIQLQFTGSPCSFTTQLFVSDDPLSTSQTYVPPNLDPLPNSLVAQSQSGTYTYNVSEAAYEWVVLKVVDTSGGSNTGILNARVKVKGPGVGA